MSILFTLATNTQSLVYSMATKSPTSENIYARRWLNNQTETVASWKINIEKDEYLRDHNINFSISFTSVANEQSLVYSIATKLFISNNICARRWLNHRAETVVPWEKNEKEDWDLRGHNRTFFPFCLHRLPRNNL